VAIDRTLIYIKFGIASGGFDFSATNTNPLVDNGSGTLVGPLLGGGIEVAFAPHWSAKLEYDHIGYVGRSLQFSGSDFGVNMPINQSQSADVNLVKAGVNYQFGGSSAVAAGRPAPLPLFTKAAPASLTHDWTGCYVGVHSGGGTRIDSFNDINGDGGLAGGQLGCNTQIGQLVFGIEGESGWTNLVDRAQFTLAGSSQQSTTRNSWSADLAARAGVAFDRALIYTRIGVASGGFDFSFSATPQTENGRGALAGLLLGGGIEVAVAPHWSARLEYDHIDYVGRNLQFSQLSAGVNNSFDQSQSASANLVKAGVNYQFGGRNVPAYASHPVMPAATFNWTGCYAGIHGGGGTQVDSFVAIIGGGGVAGGQLGCNTQIGQLVFGVESEGARTDLVDRASTALSGFSRQSITRNSWIADLSARAGVAIDRALIYSKIGMASGGFHFSTSATQPPIENGSGTLSGLLLGCGIEVAVAPHWSARLEYDHIDYVGRNFQFSEPALGSNLPFIAQSESASANLVKASVNYRFGGANPVSAKF
jgi:outer membrane immunogenic protein